MHRIHQPNNIPRGPQTPLHAPLHIRSPIPVVLLPPDAIIRQTGKTPQQERPVHQDLGVVERQPEHVPLAHHDRQEEPRVPGGVEQVGDAPPPGLQRGRVLPRQ
jgi:hypothetical protein